MVYIIIAVVSIAAIIGGSILVFRNCPQKGYKQDELTFVNQRRHDVGVINKGSSMDDKPIYVVDNQELGF